MQTRVAVMAVIVEDDAAAEKLNAVLHHYGEHISVLPCGEIQLHCTGSSTAMTVPFSELFSTQTEPP